MEGPFGMMPVSLDASWIPFVSFSIFRFGMLADTYVQQDSTQLFPDEPPSKRPGGLGIRNRYHCEDLGALVWTLFGQIHEVSTQTTCLFNGYNLVGCRSNTALSILGSPPVSWIDEHGEGLELYGHIDSMGIILEVPTRTDAVTSLRLLSAPEERARREISARATMRGRSLVGRQSREQVITTARRSPFQDR